jgi:hypothetical protein
MTVLEEQPLIIAWESKRDFRGSAARSFPEVFLKRCILQDAPRYAFQLT